MSKKIAVLLILCTFCGMFAGCFDRREIDDMCFVMAIGLDKGKTQPLRLTLQYAIPKAMGGGGGGGGDGGGGGEKALDTITLETPSLYAGLTLVNGFVGKQINISHAVVTVISEELAKSGVGKYFYGMARGREFRPNMYVAISRGSAESYLKEIKPTQEIDPSKYYQLIFSAYKYTGFAANSQFFKFYTQTESLAAQSVAALVGTSKFKSSDEINVSGSTSIEKGRNQVLEGDFKAGDIPKYGYIKGELMGLAVFDGINFVGELDGEEATDYLMVTGDFKAANFTLQDPQAADKVVILSVKQSRKPKNKVHFVDGKPVIDVRIELESDFVAIQSGNNYEDPKNLPIFENSASNFFKKEITAFLNRTAKNLNSDICGFGRTVRGKFLTWKEWENFQWLSRYKDASFNVNVEVRVRRPGLNIRTSPITSSRGREMGQ